MSDRTTSYGRAGFTWLREYSRAEWIADLAVHVAGGVFGIAACVALAAIALPDADALVVTGLGLYVAGLVSMLGCSALYNITRHAGRKALFRRLDHAAIFIMIAGTYTPFALTSIGGAWGAGLLAFVWTVAVAGATLKLAWPHRFERTSIVVYLLLGWTVVVAARPLIDAVSLAGLVLLATGGVLYTVGVVFHFWGRLKFQNAIWHGFVLVAAACHFAAVLNEVAIA